MITYTTIKEKDCNGFQIAYAIRHFASPQYICCYAEKFDDAHSKGIKMCCDDDDYAVYTTVNGKLYVVLYRDRENPENLVGYEYKF